MFSEIINAQQELVPVFCNPFQHDRRIDACPQGHAGEIEPIAVRPRFANRMISQNRTSHEYRKKA